MVTDDPDTPGDAHWEINLGNIGARTASGWLIAAPDMDINFGWGDRLQLKLDAPLDLGNGTGAWRYGVGTTLLGVKWRALDAGEDGWHVSTYPQLAVNPVASSVQRGLASPGQSFFMPVEASRHLGPIDVVAEVGRYFTQFGTGHPVGSDQWIGGLLFARHLNEATEVMIEARRTRASAPDGSGSGTLVNVGMRHELSEHVSAMGAIGREGATSDPARTSFLYYLGAQLRW